MSDNGPIAAVLFDLDGTLVDTAPDMADALNLLRHEHELEPLDYEEVRPWVSHGANALVQLGFGTAPEQPRHGQLIERFLALYETTLCRGSKLFPGFEYVLSTLERRRIDWGVVTNKPGWLAEPLLNALGLWPRTACLVAGDTVSKKKPDPMPLLHAADLLDHSPEHCLYVGDAERDVLAGRAAGMPTVVAGYGYLLPTDLPESWGPDGIIHRPSELLNWIG